MRRIPALHGTPHRQPWPRMARRLERPAVRWENDILVRDRDITTPAPYLRTTVKYQPSAFGIWTPRRIVASFYDKARERKAPPVMRLDGRITYTSSSSSALGIHIHEDRTLSHARTEPSSSSLSWPPRPRSTSERHRVRVGQELSDRRSVSGPPSLSENASISLLRTRLRRPSRNTCLAGPHRRHKPGARSSRITSTRSRPPTSSSCRPPPAGCCLCW